jgi:hypothetical protein
MGLEHDKSSAFMTEWGRTQWHALQRAAWEAVKRTT